MPEQRAQLARFPLRRHHERGDDEVGERMIDLGGELSQRVGERLVLEPGREPRHRDRSAVPARVERRR